MINALIHGRVKLGEENTAAFLKHWQTRNTIANRSGLVAEFLSDSLPMSQFPFITWHLDSDSLGNFKSYVTVGFWQDSDAFKDQVAAYFNDDKPLLDFEQYRRRRVILKPVHWRIGQANLPIGDSDGVEKCRRRDSARASSSSTRHVSRSLRLAMRVLAEP